MRAGQYIYTLCKDNEMGALAFSEYSRSSDVTNEEAKEIKKLMEYKALNDFKYLTSEELKATESNPDSPKCPYSFGFFKLQSGRYCIGLSTLLGQYKILDSPMADSRTGNYILHALIVSEEELEFYPTDLFGNGHLKNDMTVEELEAPYPVPPLPELEIDEVDSFISDEMVESFVQMNKEKFVQFVSIGLEGIRRNISVYINDTRENLVIWMAAIQKMLPLKLAKKIQYVTYELNNDKYNTPLDRIDMQFVGIRNGARGFDYASSVNNASMLCINLEPEHTVLSTGLPKSDYACMMADLYEEGIDSVYEFADFLDRLSIDTLDERLDMACKLYMAMDGKYPFSGEILAFARQYVDDSLNEEIVELIAGEITEGKWSLGVNEDVLSYILRYAGYRIANFYPICDEYLKNNLQEYVVGRENNLLSFLQTSQPDIYDEYIRYLGEEEQFLSMLQYIRNKKGNNYVVSYFELFLYKFGTVGDTDMTISREILDECKIAISLKRKTEIIGLLEVSARNRKLLMDTIKVLCDSDNAYTEVVFEVIGSWIEATSEETAVFVRKLLCQSDKYRALLIYIDSILIRKSRDPKREFWEVYQQNYKGSRVDISNLIRAYLERDSKLETIQEIMDKIPYDMYRNADLSKAVEKAFQNLSWEDVQELDDALYSRLTMIANADAFGKAYFVIAAKNLKKQTYGGDSLSEFFEAKNVYIRVLDKKDQKTYLEKELVDFYSMVRNRNDVEFIVNHFVDKEKPEIFFGVLSKILKQEEEQKKKMFMEDLEIVYGPDYKKYMKADGSGKSNFMGGLKKIFGK